MSVVTCYLTRRKLGAWVDGALDGASTRAIERHVERCPRCQAEAESYGRLKGLLQQAATVPEPDWTGLWPAIVRGIQDAKQPQPAVSSRHGWLERRWLRPRWAIGAVAAAFLAAIGIWQSLPGPERSEAGVVINAAHTEDPRGTVVAYSTPEQDVAVVWVLGLDN